MTTTYATPESSQAPVRGGRWNVRPKDENFTTVDAMIERLEHRRHASQELIYAGKDLRVAYDRDGELFLTKDGNHWDYGDVALTHRAAGQLAGHFEPRPPMAYLRALPISMVGLLYQLGLDTDRTDHKFLVVPEGRVPGDPSGYGELRAVTGVGSYGRIWDFEVAEKVAQFARQGEFTVEGVEWTDKYGHQHSRTGRLAASDTGMAMTLISGKKFEDGMGGSFARGITVWNAEDGSKSIGGAMFCLDFACTNRAFLGESKLEQFRFRHTTNAPEKFRREYLPQLEAFATYDMAGFTEAVRKAKTTRVGESVADLEKWLVEVGQFQQHRVREALVLARAETGQEPQTVWDALYGLTAVARDLPNADSRLELEQDASLTRLLSLVPVGRARA